MDTEPAQLPGAAENVELSLEEAANAFKTPAPEQDRSRDDRGRFASDGGEEIEADPEAPEADGDADIDADTGDEAEAPEEGQPESVDMPASWSKDDAEHWSSLPPETQARIAEREGQREAAVNQKFQEAANVRKANEALITEAQTSREQAVGLIDHVANLIMPERPASSMLNPQSSDYNPDAYHLLNAQFSESMELIQQLGQQRQQIVAQQHAESRRIEHEAIEEIERASRPALFKDVPDLEDEAKRPGILQDLVKYAVDNHIPADNFTAENAWRVTSAEFRLLWKASQYDKQQEAKARVRTDPKPQPKPQPAVRPGVATPRGAQVQAKLKGANERLARSGSIEDAAAVFKLTR